MAICETFFIVFSINIISGNAQPTLPSKLKKHPTNTRVWHASHIRFYKYTNTHCLQYLFWTYKSFFLQNVQMSLRIGGQDFEEMKAVKLRKFTASTALLLLLGLQMINGSLSAGTLYDWQNTLQPYSLFIVFFLCVCFVVMWGLTFVFSSFRFSGLLNIIPVVLSETLIGIIAPLLVSLALIPLSRVIRAISVNKLQPKTLLSHVYECIDYKITSDGTPYWIVAGTFYFLEQSENPDNRSCTLCYFCDKRKTTSVLAFIAILSFIF